MIHIIHKGDLARHSNQYQSYSVPIEEADYFHPDMAQKLHEATSEMPASHEF